ncbi:MAG: DNA polymerase I [Phycisphaeraceae bacterium]
MSSAKTLYLIDGHAQIFRAYFAIRGGMNSPVTGEPTHAVFGFAGMLIKLFQQFHPHYVIMAIDMPGKTFRDELYPEYKATREAAPEDLAPQIQRILEITKMFGIPIFGKVGAEADDIIATITHDIEKDPRYKDVNVRVVSKDKDLEQLLSDRVTMFDIHNDTTIDVARLKADKGLTPAQVIDALAMMGDKVDNVPGIEGIGPKTASQLLQEYGSIDGIYANIDKIKGKRRENLEKGRDKLGLSRTLVTLKDDVDIDFDLTKATVGAIDAGGLKHLFEELGFRRHSQDVERLVGRGAKPQAAASVEAPAEPAKAKGATSKPGSTATETEADSSGQLGLFPTSLFDTGSLADEGSTSEDIIPEGMTVAAAFDYSGVYTRDQLDDLVVTLKQQRIISVDTETIGLGHSAEPCGISLAWKTGHGVYIPLKSPSPGKHLDKATVLAALKPVMEDPSIPKCGHNLKYDALVLRHVGVDMQGIAFDSMIATHMIGTPAHGLDYLAENILKHKTIPISRLIGERKGRSLKGQKTMDCVALEEIVPYAAEDADMALRLYEDLLPKLRVMGLEKLSQEVEMPLVEVLVEMEFQGIRVDADELDRQAAGMVDRIADAKDRILEAAGHDFNIDSPRQLGDVLFKEFGLPIVKRKQTGPSTDIEVLEKLAEREDLTPQQDIVLNRVIEYRQLSKLVNTYLVNLKDEIDKKSKRVHAQFHQTGTTTGRLSSSNPNLQNIPIRTEIGRQIRKAFVAEEGSLLISADYSQIELRILAHLSDDPALIDAFKKDMDIHAAVASQVFGVPPESVNIAQRTSAKTINFGIIYGVTPYGLSRRIEGLDLEGARKLIADYKKRFTGIDSFLARCVTEAVNTGFVATMLGRRRRIGQIESSRPQVRSLGERLAINTVVQGSAAELIKLAMVNLHRRIRREKLPLKMLLQIHDELVLEAPASEAKAMAKIVQQEMEHAMELKVPLKVEAGVGPNWFEAK